MELKLILFIKYNNLFFKNRIYHLNLIVHFNFLESFLLKFSSTLHSK